MQILITKMKLMLEESNSFSFVIFLFVSLVIPSQALFANCVHDNPTTNGLFYSVEGTHGNAVFTQIFPMKAFKEASTKYGGILTSTDIVFEDRSNTALTAIDFFLGSVSPEVGIRTECKKFSRQFHEENPSDIECINISSISGQRMLSMNGFATQKSVSNRIQLDNPLAKGIFIIELISASKVLTTKIIIH